MVQASCTAQLLHLIIVLRWLGQVWIIVDLVAHVHILDLKDNSMNKVVFKEQYVFIQI